MAEGFDNIKRANDTAGFIALFSKAAIAIGGGSTIINVRASQLQAPRRLVSAPCMLDHTHTVENVQSTLSIVEQNNDPHFIAQYDLVSFVGPTRKPLVVYRMNTVFNMCSRPRAAMMYVCVYTFAGTQRFERDYINLQIKNCEDYYLLYVDTN